MGLEIEEAFSLIEYAFKQQEEELLFQRWIHEIQLHMGFEEFKQKLKPKKIKKDEEILKDVKEILNTFNKEVSDK
jgi:hypothetical protein